MRKILHIFGKMDRAGAETRTIEIMRNIDRTKYKFDFVACSGKSGDYDEEIAALGGVVYKEYIYTIKFFFHLFKLIRNNKYDCVHSHIHYTSGYIMFIAWLAGCKKRITHFRTAGNKTENKTLKNRILKVMVSIFSTDILSVNESTMRSVWGDNWKTEKKCSVLVNGIESKFIPDFNAYDFKKEMHLEGLQVLLHVGRIEKEKNHIFIINIFDQYLKQHSNARLVLVGRNTTKEAELVIKHIRELGLQDKILMTGLRSDVYNFLNMADVMIFPSLWEGLPGAVLEALSTGLPVVASNISCHQEIKNFIPGLSVVDLNESISKWVDAITDAIQNRSRKMIREQFNRSPFCIDKYTEKLVRIYEKG